MAPPRACYGVRPSIAAHAGDCRLDVDPRKAEPWGACHSRCTPRISQRLDLGTGVGLIFSVTQVLTITIDKHAESHTKQRRVPLA
jgi:hypothetical protein